VAKRVPIHDPIRPASTRYTIRLYPDTTRLAKRVIGFDTIMTRKKKKRVTQHDPFYPFTITGSYWIDPTRHDPFNTNLLKLNFF
jgi:hypothetical protein